MISPSFNMLFYWKSYYWTEISLNHHHSPFQQSSVNSREEDVEDHDLLVQISRITFYMFIYKLLCGKCLTFFYLQTYLLQEFL